MWQNDAIKFAGSNAAAVIAAQNQLLVCELSFITQTSFAPIS
jgi:hypothetical protein